MGESWPFPSSAPCHLWPTPRRWTSGLGSVSSLYSAHCWSTPLSTTPPGDGTWWYHCFISSLGRTPRERLNRKNLRKRNLSERPLTRTTWRTTVTSSPWYKPSSLFQPNLLSRIPFWGGWKELTSFHLPQYCHLGKTQTKDYGLCWSTFFTLFCLWPKWVLAMQKNFNCCICYYLHFTKFPRFSVSPLKALKQAVGCTTVQV